MQLYIKIVFFLCSIAVSSAQAIEITFRNDIRDQEHNIVEIAQVVTTSGLVPFRKAVKPGEEVKIPYKKILQMQLARDYGDYSRVYVVKCPRKNKDEIRMKLIDVHSNRIAGGCRTARYGEKRSGKGVKWQD